MSYNIGIIGTGYVGLVSGTCLASTGNNVMCIDIDKEKIDKLNNGITPIFEPGLEYFLQSNIKEGRITFSTDLEEAVKNCLLIFLCLPTPPNEDGSADLHHVLETAKDIANILKKNNIHEHRIVLNKSTVPVGTGAKVQSIFDTIVPNCPVDVASNPEFLREGFAVEDSMKPERVVVGTSSKYVESVMRELYLPFVRSGNPIYVMDIKSAEVTKYAANAFLATKISFMNDLSRYCELVGADIDSIRLGIGSDTRIGKRFLFAGIGYGGSCFPKDVRALIYSGEDAGVSLEIVKAAHHVNSIQIERFIELILKKFNNDIANKKFAIWGLAFKPNTDDTRESPAFRLIEALLEHHATVKVYDPEAQENTKIKFNNSIEYAKDMYDCVSSADAIILTTEWNVFRNPDFKKLKSLLNQRIMFDGRNVYTNDEMKANDFEYYSIGRKYSEL